MKHFRVVISIVFLFSVTPFAWGQSDFVELGLEGYSPVSYFTRNQAEQGSEAFQASFEGKTYYFTDQEQVDMFNEDPKRYLPRFGQFCPYSLALGKKLRIDPTNFKVVGDTLLLFHQSDEGGNGLAAFESHSDPDEILERAQSQLLLLKF